jgi:hypothetical protein
LFVEVRELVSWELQRFTNGENSVPIAGLNVGNERIEIFDGVEGHFRLRLQRSKSVQECILFAKL